MILRKETALRRQQRLAEENHLPKPRFFADDDTPA